MRMKLGGLNQSPVKIDGGEADENEIRVSKRGANFDIYI